MADRSSFMFSVHKLRYEVKKKCWPTAPVIYPDHQRADSPLCPCTQISCHVFFFYCVRWLLIRRLANTLPTVRLIRFVISALARRLQPEVHFLNFLRVQVSNSQTNKGSEAQKTIYSFHHDLPRSSALRFHILYNFYLSQATCTRIRFE